MTLEEFESKFFHTLENLAVTDSIYCNKVIELISTGDAYVNFRQTDTEFDILAYVINDDPNQRWKPVGTSSYLRTGNNPTINDVKNIARSMVLKYNETIENYNKTKENMENNNQKVDNVNHPKHYTRENAIQCIDEMVMVFGIEETMHFCKLNAWKYRYRAADKNGAEDIAKSDWYMNKYKELSDKLVEKQYVTTITK